MKPVLLQQVRLIESGHPLNNQVLDIRINARGEIAEIRDHLVVHQEEDVFHLPGVCVSRGWTDLIAHFSDPGEEHRETLQSGMHAALAGGYARVGVSPITRPVCDEKSRLQYIRTQVTGITEPVLLGTVTKNALGKELAELYDLEMAGARAFFDGKQEVSALTLAKALHYTREMGHRVILHPMTESLQRNGQVHEGKNAMFTGLKTIPSLSEELMVDRAISILRYTGGKLHFHGISTGNAIDRIKAAKAEGLDVTADVIAHQLAFDDQVYLTFNTHFKVFPPFRSADEVSHLLRGLKEGTIDAICSDHLPVDPEGKECEFDLAEPGISGIQTAFSVLNTQTRHMLTLEQRIQLLTEGPERILGIPTHSIHEGQPASLTLFDPERSWTYSCDDHLSRSKNTPFFGETFIGKPVGVIHKGQARIETPA